ncbi:Pleckstrin homology domain-containing family G member 7 [Trichinella pseudospiralis]|uniref:Pleckstrin homology domain-containing family G member 7 n=1 Tax=Trichinella pseudospiralis TaxID=6337 RepID=A0A0V1DXN0_TRIPS|nr:Pleckstrin homology domain-containing family G member 7 [Trichinella pseudospiralis]
MKAFPKESLRRICFAIARLSYIYRSSVEDKLWRPAHYQMFASAVAVAAAHCMLAKINKSQFLHLFLSFHLVNKPYESGNSYMMPIVQWHSGVLDENSDAARANDEEDIQNVELPPAVLSRRDALVPEDRKVIERSDSASDANSSSCNSISGDNSLFVSQRIMLRNELRLFHLAISQREIIRAGLQKSSNSSQKFGTGDEDLSKSKSPWIFKRLYDWSQRAKAREIIRRVRQALDSQDSEYVNEKLQSFLNKNWTCLYGDEWIVLEPQLQKRLQAMWELFHSELIFLYQRLLIVRNVFKEPLKKCQVDGDFLAVEPDILFGNLEEICQISYGFCNEFLHLLIKSKEKNCFGSIKIIGTLLTRFFKNASIVDAYHTYCVNYKTALEYLENLRKTDDRFAILEKVCTGDLRCKRLQLEDFLISPLQRITRLPILIREVLKFTKDEQEIEILQTILDTIQESLQSIDESIKETVSRQFCESSIAHPNRQLMHEGLLYCIENQKPSEVYLFLFNDMLLKANPENWAGNACKFVVQHQPVPLDSCVFCDIGPKDSKDVKHAFALLHVTRFSQLIALYTLHAPTKECKETWIRKFQDCVSTIELIHRRSFSQCSISSRAVANRSPTPSDASYKDCLSQIGNSESPRSISQQNISNQPNQP